MIHRPVVVHAPTFAHYGHVGRCIPGRKSESTKNIISIAQKIRDFSLLKSQKNLGAPRARDFLPFPMILSIHHEFPWEFPILSSACLVFPGCLHII
jgi:hypothetical protein